MLYGSPVSPLDSNKVEASLNRAIPKWKNSQFYKAMNRVHLGNVNMSPIHSAELNKVNFLSI